MAFEREKQSVNATEILQAIANGEDIRLQRCAISGNLDINRLFEKEEKFNIDNLNQHQQDDKIVITLGQMIVFNECAFEDNVFFAGHWGQSRTVGVVFKRDISFNLSAFSGQCRFDEAIFDGQAGFDGCKFERIAGFRNMNFKSAAMFRTVTFTGYALFSGSVFKKECSFANTHFGKGGNFKQVVFKGRTNFTDVYSGSKSVPVFESVKFERFMYGDGETFWRFIKQAATDAGYYRFAGESFFNERCTSLWRRFLGTDFDSVPFSSKLFRIVSGIRLLPEVIFGRLLFGYGERPNRVLFAGALLILFCAVYYFKSSCLLYAGEHFEPRFFDSLYFSAITFATLGLGDIYPEPHSAARIVIMIESLSGATLMSLFVVCLSKRFSRG